MNGWWIAAIALMAALVPCGWVCLRGAPLADREQDIMIRLLGLELAGTIDVLLLLVIAEAMHRAPFTDLALALALLTFSAGLVFARFLERWL